MITNLKHGDKYNKKREAKYFSFFMVMKIIQISFLEAH